MYSRTNEHANQLRRPRLNVSLLAVSRPLLAERLSIPHEKGSRRLTPSMRADDFPGVLPCHVSGTLRNECVCDWDSEEKRMS
jgi:hypothetical protein